ncbi:XdhC family protein [Argonema antarcticum]|uniref:XdhC family protein n=1 Tax=Argonema antarcticum TaxID=2942763 RepID=UPI00201140F6|nr:XdhC/CoxI family protein [Argonema antarcticum]MCL1470798.1 XdhC family protein [Argonema antarcticum A004/B2]
MNELQAIIDAFADVQRNHKNAVLATVVKVKGSAYRRPGARMLITEDGYRVGAISGGCLEDDVCDRAKKILATGIPTVVTYDTTSDEDIFWGLGMGCNGIIQVLIEPLQSQFNIEQLAFLSCCLRLRQRGVMATVFQSSGDTLASITSRIFLTESDTPIDRVADAELAKKIIENARQVLKHGRTSQIKSYQWSNSEAEVLIEVIQPPVSLVVFGAGDDAIPVVRLAKELGWYVTVIDRRAAYATSTRFQEADAIAISHPEEMRSHLTLDCHTAAVVMTHNYLCDRDILQTLIPSPLPYIGILGARNRTEKLLQDLQQIGFVLDSEQLNRLYAPVGLDIGAETPPEIALSIIAEIKAVMADRSGGFLRNRKAPIHLQKQYDRTSKMLAISFKYKI